MDKLDEIHKRHQSNMDAIFDRHGREVREMIDRHFSKAQRELKIVIVVCVVVSASLALLSYLVQ